MSICTETYAKAENVAGDAFESLAFLFCEIGESQDSMRTS